MCWHTSRFYRCSACVLCVVLHCLQVVGFTHGYHAAAVMGSGAKIVHGVRLAQVAGIRLALHTPTPQPDGGPGQVFMQLDGEPWMQHVPASSGAARVVVRRASGVCIQF